MENENAVSIKLPKVAEKEKKKETIIIAPHPDDECIGCYSVLKKEKCIIIYPGDTPKDRQEEALGLRKHIDIKIQMFQMNIPTMFLHENSKFYFPDPIYEIHPQHRMWGSMGESLLRMGLDVIFYNTNMNAPYIHEVGNSTEKEDLLNKVYPSQKSLWEYDKKYILFEGLCKWIIE